MFRILWDPSSESTESASLKLLVMFYVRIRCLAAWNLDLWCVCARHTHTTGPNFKRCLLSFSKKDYN